MKSWCVLAALLAPAIALAQPTEEQQQQAKAFVERAKAASLAGDHETAAQQYQRAYRVIPQPILLSNIASEYQAMKKPRWAVTYFCQYLAAEPGGANAGYAKTQLRALHVELGGSASAKDDELCKPITDGGKSPPQQPAPEAGSTTPPPAATPPPPTSSPPPPSTAVTEPPPPSDTSQSSGMSPWRIAGLGLAGVGVVVFGIGAYYGFEAKSIEEEITNHPVEDPWPVDLREREARGESYNRRAIILMAGGGIAVAAGAAAFLLYRPNASTQDQVTFTPVVSPDNVGFAAAGRF